MDNTLCVLFLPWAVLSAVSAGYHLVHASSYGISDVRRDENNAMGKISAIVSWCLWAWIIGQGSMGAIAKEANHDIRAAILLAGAMFVTGAAAVAKWLLLKDTSIAARWGGAHLKESCLSLATILFVCSVSIYGAICLKLIN